MNWNALEANWPILIERMTRLWPETEREKLSRMKGNAEDLVNYLARVHDLTPTEAREAIESWLMPGVRRNTLAAAE